MSYPAAEKVGNPHEIRARPAHTSSEHPDIVLTRAKLLRTSKNTQRCD